MSDIRRTQSICCKCGAIVSAITRSAYIFYECSCGIKRAERVEIDEEFIQRFGYGRTADLYKSLIVNITYRCDEKCRLCYAPTGGDKPVEWVVAAAKRNKSRKIWLCGGEPTIHPQFFDIVKAVPNFKTTLTNGKSLCDEAFFKEYAKVTNCKTILPAVVSIHSSPPDYKYVLMDKARKYNLLLDGGMFSLTNVEELDDIVRIWLDNRDVIPHIRIRTPFNSWKQHTSKQIYLSELYNKFVKIFPSAKVVDFCGGNSIFNIHMMVGDKLATLCSAPSATAMDIDACKYAPYALAENGKIYPVPVAWVMNEHTTCHN